MRKKTKNGQKIYFTELNYAFRCVTHMLIIPAVHVADLRTRNKIEISQASGKL